MPPPRWSTDLQLEFLKKRFPIYLQTKAEKLGTKSEKRLNEFHADLMVEWFVAWPEVDALIALGKLPPAASEKHDDHENYVETAEHLDIVGAAVKKRREMLKNWYRNEFRKAAGQQGAQRSKPVLLSSLLNGAKKRRVHKPVEIYQGLYKDKIRALMAVEVGNYEKEHGVTKAAVNVVEEVELEIENDLESLGENGPVEKEDNGQETGVLDP
ncbi:hypothetical protein FPV67DRAFT_1453283 [Lyophyllum atratum]|nr:hypothetical protein FPV67DRAFT_1453283 [Lyophyllum atratum]